MQLSTFVDALKYYVEMVPVDRRSAEYLKASRAMARVDPNDSEFLALAIHLGVPIWSHDRHFKRQGLTRVVASADILKHSHELPALWMALNEK